MEIISLENELKSGEFAHITAELIKYLLFIRSQTYCTIDSLREDERMIKNKQSDKFLNEVSELFENLEKAFKEHEIYRLLICFGNNASIPSEYYLLHFPDHTIKSAASTEIDQENCRKHSSKLLRQILSHFVNTPFSDLKITKATVIIESAVGEEFEGFLPKRKFTAESLKCKHSLDIHFLFNSKKENRENEQSIEINTKEEENNIIITNNGDDDCVHDVNCKGNEIDSPIDLRMWYQSTVIIHGITTPNS